MKNDILSLIEGNSRLAIEDIAKCLDLSKEKVSELIFEMECDKTICGYPTLVNWNKTNNEKVTALIEVKVTPQRGQGFDKVAERIYNFDEVKSLYLMSGGFDFTVIIEGKTIQEVARFVSSKLAPMEAVLSTGTHFVLKKYKDHGTVFVQNSKEERMLITP